MQFKKHNSTVNLQNCDFTLEFQFCWPSLRLLYHSDPKHQSLWRVEILQEHLKGKVVLFNLIMKQWHTYQRCACQTILQDIVIMITILKLIKFDKKKKNESRKKLVRWWWTIIIPSTYNSKRNVMIKHWSLDQELKECLAKSPKSDDSFSFQFALEVLSIEEII